MSQVAHERIPSSVSTVAALVAYTLLTLLFFRVWLPHLSTALIGAPEDNMQDLWITFYSTVTTPGRFFQTDLIRFPEGTTLYYHAVAYPKVFAIALLSKFLGSGTSTLVALHNASLLLSFPLASAGAFLLIRHLTGSSSGALLGGFVYGFNPSHIEHSMHHIGVSSIEFIPLFVLAYLLAIEKKSALWLAAAVAFYALSALSHWYYLFYVGYFIALHFAWTMYRARALPGGWHRWVPLACFGATLLVLSPWLVPMVREAMTNASVYQPAARAQVADLVAYVAFPQFHLLSFLSDWVYWRLSGNVWEATVYLGLVNLALLAALGRPDTSRDPALLRWALAGTAAFCILASGSWLYVLGQKTIPMPDLLLSQLPFFRNVRGPSRAIVFTYLFFAILVAQAWLSARRHARGPTARYGLGVTALLVVIDFYPAHRLPMTPVDCAPSLSVIRDDPTPDFGVLDLPSGRPAAYAEGNAYMLRQLCHRRPIAQGTTSRNVATTLRDRLETADMAAQQRQLASAKIRYIVLHKPAGGLFRWRDEDGSIEQYRRAYPAVADEPEMTVLQVY